MPDHKPSVIQRGFQIANEGKCRRVSQIVEQLSREGYEHAHGHLSGALIKRQLTALLKRLDL